MEFPSTLWLLMNDSGNIILGSSTKSQMYFALLERHDPGSYTVLEYELRGYDWQLRYNHPGDVWLEQYAKRVGIK